MVKEVSVQEGGTRFESSRDFFFCMLSSNLFCCCVPFPLNLGIGCHFSAWQTVIFFRIFARSTNQLRCVRCEFLVINKPIAHATQLGFAGFLWSTYQDACVRSRISGDLLFARMQRAADPQTIRNRKTLQYLILLYNNILKNTYFNFIIK